MKNLLPDICPQNKNLLNTTRLLPDLFPVSLSTVSAVALILPC